LAALAEKTKAAREVLLAEETKRDRRLADLTVSLRPVLEQSERLSELLREATRFEQMIAERRGAFSAADQTAAGRLAAAGDEVTAAEERVRELTSDAARKRAEEQERLLALRRVEAQLRRVDIERRNVADQARALVAPGENMPPHLASRYVELGRQRERAEGVVQQHREAHRQQTTHRKGAEEAERRARADLGRVVAQKEGLLVAQEGVSRTYAESLEEAELGRALALAEAGRSIIELRGEVPVEAEVRRALLEADRRVREAARHLEVCAHAAGTVDEQAQKEGRNTLLALVVVLVVAVAYLAFGR
jgi:hypothetical protein